MWTFVLKWKLSWSFDNVYVTPHFCTIAQLCYKAHMNEFANSAILVNFAPPVTPDDLFMQFLAFLPPDPKACPAVCTLPPLTEMIETAY